MNANLPASEMCSSDSCTLRAKRYIFSPRRRWLVLLIYGGVLLTTNQWFPVIDDEASQVGSAAQSTSVVVRQFLTPEAQAHPPLPDLLLHYWIAAIGPGIACLSFLRLPGILAFLLGILLLCRAAARLGGDGAAQAVLWLCVFWPYGFHFGRIATWFPLSFMTLSWATDAYLAWTAFPSPFRASLLALASLAAVYTSYVAWAFLFCLALDFCFHARSCAGSSWKQSSAVAAFVLAAFLPGWVALAELLVQNVHPVGIHFRAIFLALFDICVLFGSESIAPWVWSLSILLGLAIATVIFVIIAKGPRLARVMLAGVMFVLTAMTVLDLANAKRVIVLGPWLLLATGVTVASLPKGKWRAVLLFALLLLGTLSWTGIVSRRFYATRRFFEPWQDLAREAAARVRSGNAVIGNHPSFFFYLTLEVQPPSRRQPFVGIFGQQLESLLVYDPAQWVARGRPITPGVLVVRGVSLQHEMDETERSLDQRCALRELRKLLPDPDAAVKSHFFPEAGQPAWRVEIREYACGTAAAIP